MGNSQSSTLHWFWVLLCLNLVILTGAVWDAFVTSFLGSGALQNNVIKVVFLVMIDGPIFYLLLNKEKRLLLVFAALLPVYEVSKMIVTHYHQSDSYILDYLIKLLLLTLVSSPTLFISWVLNKEYKSKIEEINESEDRYSKLVQHSPDMIAVVHNGVIQYVNEAGLKLVGCTNPTQIIGQSLSTFLPDDLGDSIATQIDKDTVPANKLAIESKLLRSDNNLIDVEITSITLNEHSKQSKQLIVRDITERKRIEEAIKHMAYHDTLTGLPNRNYLYTQFMETLNNDEQSPFAIIFIDLDRFKYINDSMGHDIGDMLLQSVAERLKSCIRDTDVVSRQGGDEFIILIRNATKTATAQIAKRILTELGQPHRLNNYEVYSTPSIGISMFPDHGQTIETLVKHADAAMYKAKEKGKNNYQFFTNDLHENIERKVALEKQLRSAIGNQQFSLRFQPQVNLKSGKIVGVEALLQWVHPQLGSISPGEFIPLAEEIGLINDIGEWVLRTACAQAKTWNDNGYTDLAMSVNLSAIQFKSMEIVSTIKKILMETQLDPKFLKLEITEGSVMENAKENIDKLGELKDIGVRISIDDFGTGYSSLNYLKLLPIDDLKIDKSFIRDIMEDQNDLAIAKAIIDLGRSLNLNVIAEGVECRDQLEILLQNNCEEAQGYYFSKPITAYQFEQMFMESLIRKVG